MISLILSGMILSASVPPNSLVWSATPEEKVFVKQAKAFLISQGLVPITLDEINVKLEAEKVKDVVGCNDVTCISDITGAYGIKYVARIHPKEAIISLHNIDQMGKTMAEVSIELITESQSQTEKLVEMPILLTGYDTGDYDDFNQCNNKPRPNFCK